MDRQTAVYGCVTYTLYPIRFALVMSLIVLKLLIKQRDLFGGQLGARRPETLYRTHESHNQDIPDSTSVGRVLSASNMPGTLQLFCLTMGSNCTVSMTYE
jgi:hypothetical protein